MINSQSKCKIFVYDNEGCNDDVINDLIANSQKFEDLQDYMTERDDTIDESLETLNKLLADIFHKHLKCESKFTEICDKCKPPSNRCRFNVEDMPWISEDCKTLYSTYKNP